ncbi:maleylpyruvate isomerase N-terminal domain-containing protein [Actinoplanes sp. URMC 104]|uniref:maleylpyruvate isomerase N-terminal domain-containing protein n=1 Tax=Actinoplanes sp. URMC 104 TaxID=3423409 RepID=UPI003F1B3283
MNVDHDEARAAFLAGLDAFVTCAGDLGDRDLMAASRCTGWTVGDVVVHVHLGLQEMLLGLVSSTGEQPGTDAATYWQGPPPATDDEADEVAGIRFVRLLGAAYRRPSGAVRHLLPTVAGVRAATARLEPGAVRFQGHVLSSGDFLATWAVELAVHHLDLGRELTLPPPAPAALRLARSTVEALAGRAAPGSWADDTTVLLGAGRVRPDARQQAEAPELTGKLPVLG